MKERRHKRVAHYMRNEDLFSKDIVIFPCCLDSPKHWFLVVAVLGLDPCVVVLDSCAVPDGRKEVAEMIIEYLEEERRVKGHQGPTFRILNPEVLQQPDGYNCGVFIIMFMEMILATSALFITQPKKKQLVDWFANLESSHHTV